MGYSLVYTMFVVTSNASSRSGFGYSGDRSYESIVCDSVKCISWWFDNMRCSHDGFVLGAH